MNEDVVHIDGDVTFIDQFSEDEVHHRLKGGRCVREAEKHHHGFKKASIGFESCLPLVTVANADVIIPPMDIQLCKECRSATVHSHESIHEFVY